MIDKRIEPYYDIMISIFLGVVLVLTINTLYESPRTIIVFSDVNKYLHNNGCSSIKIDN